jgi:hypothetical protein
LLGVEHWTPITRPDSDDILAEDQGTGKVTNIQEISSESEEDEEVAETPKVGVSNFRDVFDTKMAGDLTQLTNAKNM